MQEAVARLDWGDTAEEVAAAAVSSKGARTMDPEKRPSGSDCSEEMQQILIAAAPSILRARTIDPEEGLSCSDSSGEMLQKMAAGVPASRGSLTAFHGNSTTQDREDSDAKHPTKKPRIEDEGDMDLSGVMLQKKSAKAEADSGSSVDMLHEHPAEEAADTAKHADSDKTVHVREEDTRRLQELEDLIKEMDASCIGESIEGEEFLGYFDRLASGRSWTNLDDKLEDKDICEKEDLHGVYRLKYLQYQIRLQMSKGEPVDDDLKSLLDISVDDCSSKFLEEKRFFRSFEKDWTLDWFFHPDYLCCSSLTDYQRLVLRNHGGTEYARWSEYFQYLNSYKTEKQYVKYCEDLSVKLKWMENYVAIYSPSSTWNYITSRGACQAIKIAATDFQAITPCLAYNGYNEFEESMLYDFTFYKEYGGLYFEIWRRITQDSLSFEVALAKLCELNMFPLRQRRMKGALECVHTMGRMKEEYDTCTDAITKKNTEEEARKLIAEAVLTRVTAPKPYDQYIRKKIDIARIIGVLPQED